MIFGTEGTCSASTCKSGSEIVMIRPSRNESTTTMPSFLVRVIAVPTRSPIGVIAISAPAENSIMPTSSSAAPIRKQSRMLGEIGAMVKESSSTMQTIGSTARTASIHFSDRFLRKFNPYITTFPQNFELRFNLLS